MANTGYKGWNTLEEYDVNTGQATGNTKPNVEGDPDYVAPVYDESTCPLFVLAWRPIDPYCTLTSSGATTTCQGIDLSIILDITGSMRSSIDNLKVSLTNIVGEIVNKYGDYRLSLFTVHDEASGGGTTYYDMLVPFSLSNELQVQEALNSLTANGGDGRAEPHDLAFEGLLNGEAGTFRNDITKAVFVITDAPNSGTNDAYDNTDITKVQQLSTSAENMGVKVYSIITGIPDEDTLNMYIDSDADYVGGLYVGNTGGTKYTSLNGTVDTQIVQALGEVECETVEGDKFFDGFKAYRTLEEYNPETGLSTGVTKPNVSSDPDGVPPEYKPNECPFGGTSGDENFDDGGSDLDTITVNPTQLTFPYTGGSQTVEVTADSSWSALGAGVGISPNNGLAGTTSVTITTLQQANGNNVFTEIPITLNNGEDSAYLTVEQEGNPTPQ